MHLQVDDLADADASVSTTSSIGRGPYEACYPRAAYKAYLDVLQAPARRVEIPALSTLSTCTTAPASRSPSVYQTDDPFTFSRVATGEVLDALQSPETARAACWWLYETETIAYTPDIARTGLSATDFVSFKTEILDLLETMHHDQNERPARRTSLRARLRDSAFFPRAALRRRKSDIAQRALVAVLAAHCAGRNADLKDCGKPAAYSVAYIEQIGIRFEIRHIDASAPMANGGLRM